MALLIHPMESDSSKKTLNLPWLGLWNTKDYVAAVQNGSINLLCQLYYTDHELAQMIKSTNDSGLNFKDRDHYRVHLYLNLCRKLPKTIFESVFKHFHRIYEVTDRSKLPVQNYQVALMIPERFQFCPLTEDILCNHLHTCNQNL